MKRIIIFLLSVLLVFNILQSPIDVEAKEGNIVVIIDPGHGGTNLGANPVGFLEKDMTLVTALAMREELEKYEGVSVYLTREVDAELSLEQRAVIAQSVNADFLFSLHYNMSANHYFYGSEVWAQSTGENYTKGYSVGKLLLNEFSTYFGTFNRGLKVKLNNKGKEYYGILRATSERGIPAVIVEHAHLDHAADIGYANTVLKLQAFGRADATAVAKYYGLKSTALGVDYKDYPKETIPAKATPMVQDLTPPEAASIQVTNIDTVNKKISASINAADSNTGIMYYSYTVNGGVTWSPLQPFNSQGNTLAIEIPADFNGNRIAAVRAFNSYDGMTESVPVAY